MLAPIAYTHTEIGYADLVATMLGGGAVLAFVVVAMRAQGTERRLPRTTVVGAFVVAITSLLALGFTFSRMTVSVRDDTLSWSFALGLLRHQVPLSEVVAASVVQNRVNDGFGIHDTRRGTLYNVGGAWSVHVALKDGSAFQLGTDQPDSLLKAIWASRR